MPYRIINKFCLDCPKRLSSYRSFRCYSCNKKYQYSLVPQEVKDAIRKGRKEYKALYFQLNKEKIMQKRKENPPSSDKTRQYSYKYNYKIDASEVDALYIVMRGKCMCCGIFMEQEDKSTKACIDHDHKTGKIRGLICRKCNLALGLFKDDIKILKSAIEYLGGGYI